MTTGRTSLGTRHRHRFTTFALPENTTQRTDEGACEQSPGRLWVREVLSGTRLVAFFTDIQEPFAFAYTSTYHIPICMLQTIATSSIALALIAFFALWLFLSRSYLVRFLPPSFSSANRLLPLHLQVGGGCLGTRCSFFPLEESVVGLQVTSTNSFILCSNKVDIKSHRYLHIRGQPTFVSTHSLSQHTLSP